MTYGPHGGGRKNAWEGDALRNVVAPIAVAGLMAVLVLGFVPGAPAHAKLTKAEPSPGSTVRTPPQVVRLWFALGGEELDPKRSTVSVWDSKGRRVDDGKGGADLNDLDRLTMIARLRPIGPSTYTVKWKAISTPDDSTAQGTFRFTVAPR